MPDVYGVRLPRDDYTHYNAKDQWGRMYLIQLDVKSRAPCAIQTCFTDPLATPRPYLDLASNNPNLVTIDYPRWLKDVESAEIDYNGRKIEVSRALYGERAEVDRPATQEVLRIIGKFNGATSDQVKLAMAGDTAVLGLIASAPEAEPELDLTSKEAYRIFVHYHCKVKGKSLPEAAEAWQAHKAALAEATEEVAVA